MAKIDIYIYKYGICDIRDMRYGGTQLLPDLENNQKWVGTCDQDPGDPRYIDTWSCISKNQAHNKCTVFGF